MSLFFHQNPLPVSYFFATFVMLCIFCGRPLELVSSMGESAKPFVKWVIFIPMIVVQKKAVGNLLADCTKGTPGVETEMDKRGYHTATGYPEIAQLLLTVALATVRRGCFFLSPKMETVAGLTVYANNEKSTHVCA